MLRPLLRSLEPRRTALPHAASQIATTAFFSSTRTLVRDGARRRHNHTSAAASTLHVRHNKDRDVPQPARQPRVPRRAPQRTSLLEQLRESDNHAAGSASMRVLDSSSETNITSLAVTSHHPTTAAATATGPSPYLSSPTLISRQRQAEANAAAATPSIFSHPPTTPVPAAASLELAEQQRALRNAFTHARQHHNVKLRKDPRVYRAECKAFRQAHQGRPPTAHEVSRTVAVPLAPVGVLNTLAHADPKRSLLRSAVQEAVLLHNAVAKNELVKSNMPQLVRCLRCFHVYTAQPRTLWGGEVEQSGIEYEKVQARAAADALLQRKPWLRKRVGSVGRRQRAAEANPTCCPQCRSPRAQWLMEYVHHHTHEKQ